MVNSVLPNVLSEIKNMYANKNLQVIHVTTDCVYNGKTGGYDENSPHECIDDYSMSKSLGENKNLTNIRTSIIGEEITYKKSLLEWVRSNKAGSTIYGYVNHLWNGVTCLELAKFIDDNMDDFDYTNLVSTILGVLVMDDNDNPLTFALEIIKDESSVLVLSDIKEVCMDEYLDLLNLSK